MGRICALAMEQNFRCEQNYPSHGGRSVAGQYHSQSLRHSDEIISSGGDGQWGGCGPDREYDCVTQAFCAVGFARRAHSSVALGSMAIHRAWTVAADYTWRGAGWATLHSLDAPRLCQTSPPHRSSKNDEVPYRHSDVLPPWDWAGRRNTQNSKDAVVETFSHAPMV